MNEHEHDTCFVRERPLCHRLFLHSQYQRLVFFISIIELLLGFPLFANSSINSGLLDIPISDELYYEVYNFIDVLSAKKVIRGKTKNTRPYSYGEVIHVLELLQKKVESGDVKLTSIESKKLQQYLDVFLPESQKH